MRCALTLFAASLLAQDAQAPQTKPIPAVLYGEVYRARGQVLEAKTAMDAAIIAVQEYCGDKYSVSIDLMDTRKNLCILKADAH